jgi:hypothetical protein
MNALVTHDRGLGSVYERYCFYQRVDDWAREYDVHSFLEGPLDGMAGIAGVHGVGLARRGITVTSAVDRQDKVPYARGVYDRFAKEGTAVDVRVTSPDDVDSLPEADMVVSYHGLPQLEDWGSYLKKLASKAKKVLVVSVCNPENWGFTAVRWLGKVRGIKDFEPPPVWHKEVLGPALWELGRVREHVYFDCPWWPDMPVAAGQSVADRAKKLLQELGAKKRLQKPGAEVPLSNNFVYGADRWPYFGGDGWNDELLPALLRHPAFDGSTTKYLPRLAHLHAFVVDMRPRTPQARRRLAQVPAAAGTGGE